MMIGYFEVATNLKNGMRELLVGDAAASGHVM
jgi:hypothetical protein